MTDRTIFGPNPIAILMVNLCLGFALCGKLVSDLYHAYWGQLAFSLSQAHAALVSHWILQPLGWATIAQGNEIRFPSGARVCVVLECLTPEITIGLLLCVWLVAVTWRQRWQGILLCPVLFWWINLLRIALLAVLQEISPTLFDLFHGLTLDLFLLVVAVIGLWSWLTSSRSPSFRRTSFSISVLWFLRFFFYAGAFFLLAQGIDSYLGPWYQRSLLGMLRIFYLRDVPLSSLHLPHLLHLASACVPLALLWSLSFLHRRLKIGATLGILALRLGCDIYLGQALLSAYFLRTSSLYQLEVVSNHSRIVFQIASLSIAALVILLGHLLAPKPLALPIHPQMPPQKPYPVRFEITFLAALSFFLTPFVIVEQALLIDLLCLALVLGFSGFLTHCRAPIRWGLVGTSAFLVVVGQSVLLSPAIYEERAYFHSLQQEYAQSLVALNNALAFPGPNTPSRLYLERALGHLVLGNPQPAREDLEKASLVEKESACASAQMKLWRQVYQLPTPLVEEILRDHLLRLFPDSLRQRWTQEEKESSSESVGIAKK